MENTRIPKHLSGIRPPTIKVGTIPKILPFNPESKTCTTTSGSATGRVPLQLRTGLRRRSKSVTDLRSVNSKPTTASLKSIKLREKADTGKTAIKRPLGDKNEGEMKQPKVPKMKIPDWDYKARFLELQRKYGLLQDDLKVTKNKLSGLQNIEEELETLQQIKTNQQKEIQMLENNKFVITRENESLRTENVRVKSQLEKIQTTYDVLKSEHDILTVENKENLIQLHNVQKAHEETQLALKRIEVSYQDLEAKTQQLKTDLEEQESLRRILHNKIQDLKGNIRVFCRVRPPINDERDKHLCSILFLDESTLEIRQARENICTMGGRPMDIKQEFVFDKIFPPEAEQSEVFEELSQLVQSALDGFHVCVFAYGQTGSGKTYTMQGSQQDGGMIPRAIDLIFEKINKLKNCDWKYEVTASFLEIYNENIKDLLNPNSSHNYELRFNEGRGVTVTNLKIISINSAIELKMLMEEAHKNRAVAATDFNEHSSRSHAVTKIHLLGHNSETKVIYNGSINLVDLAGSESAKTSSAERLTETKNINKSLSALGNVMLALHNKDSHVPYRNSKLTFLLQSCLGGNSKTLMFVNISPFEECYMESINSLRFAAKVKDIKTVAKKNKSYSVIQPAQTPK